MSVPSSVLKAAPLRAVLEDGVLCLAMSRPEARNALDESLADALRVALESAAHDPHVRDIVLGGDDLDASTALASGLVTAIVADDDLLGAAADRARRALGRSPQSYGAVKRLLALAADVDLHSGLVAESLAQSYLLTTADHREGLAAVREQREPAFQGL